MATFNSTAVVPSAYGSSPVLVTWPSVQQFDPLVLAASSIAVVWIPESERSQSIGAGSIAFALFGETSRFQYADGYADGELFGFSSQREEDMEPIAPGETDTNKKTRSFRVYTTTGLPASGNPGEGDVCSPAASELQTNRDLAGYVNYLGVFSHVGDGVYRYTFDDSEVASGGGEGNVWLRLKVSGFRTVVLRVPIRNEAPTTVAVANAVLDAARSGHVGVGSIGEGIALAASLLQGNYYMDNVTNTTNGQTAARIRCFHTGAAAQAATAGGTGQGEFATFLVTTTYNGVNKITEHRVVQQ